MEEDNKKRIVKNSFYLNLRMVIALLVSLYTSRVVLQVLGFSDFGIYNVVSGFVSMFMVINASLQAGTQRFLSYGIGEGNQEELKSVFSNIVFLHTVIAIITFVLLETIGLWFAFNKLNIPPDRFETAMWIYQMAVVSSCFTIMSNPFQAAITSHEEMGVYALLTTTNIVLKLVVVFLISSMPFSHLFSYALLLLIVNLTILVLFMRYSMRNFQECKFEVHPDRRILKELCGFSGWMIVGTTTNTLSTQGVNVLINIFFSPVFNASRAVAIQVKDALNSFVSNIMMAVNPQIVKLFARQDESSMMQLVFTSSKLSFVVLFSSSIPFLLYADELLELWLGKVPPLCSLFLRLTLVEATVQCLYVPISQISQASGKIKYYQLAISSVFILTFFMSCVVFLLRLNVYSVFVVGIFFSVIGLICRLLVLSHVNHLSVGEYFKKVLRPMPIVMLTPMIVALPLIKKYPHNMLTMSIISSIGMLACLATFWVFGMQSGERHFVISTIRDRFHKRFA